MFEIFLRKFGVCHKLTTTYLPQANGLNEKANRAIVTSLRVSSLDFPSLKWSTFLQDVVSQYNRTTHSVTGFTPFLLFFGQDEGFTGDIVEVRVRAVHNSDAFKMRKKLDYDRKHKSMVVEVGGLLKWRWPPNYPGRL